MMRVKDEGKVKKGWRSIEQRRARSHNVHLTVHLYNYGLKHNPNKADRAPRRDRPIDLEQTDSSAGVVNS